MNGLSIVILIVVIIGAVLAVRYIIRHRGSGCSGCGGDCSGCDRHCGKRKEP